MEIINQRLGTAWERISSAPIFQKVPFHSQNLVTYLRIIMLVYCHLIMNSMPWRTYLLYLIILMLDISCEILASEQLQYSRFGAILAQLIRQCAVLGLLMHLCEQFPGKRAFYLQMIALMEIFNFVLNIHANDLKHRRSRKFTKNWLVTRHYYTEAGPDGVAHFLAMFFYLALFHVAHYRYGFWRFYFPIVALLWSLIAIWLYDRTIYQMKRAWRTIIDYDRRYPVMDPPRPRTLFFE